MTTPSFPIQFVERNFSTKDIDKMAGPGLLVRSIFPTLQGEGPFAMYPAVFIRLAGCNRGAKTACQWCDTDFLVSKSTLLLIPEILREVAKYRNADSLDKPLIVITGGEPLLHSRMDELVVALHDQGYTVQIETNGDLLRLTSAPRAVVVVSPKVSARAARYTKPHKEMLERADYLKFVVDADPASAYHTLPEYAYEFADRKGSHHVFVSPINEYARPLEPGELATMWGTMYDKEKCRVNHAYAAKLAMEKAFRLSLQTHLYVELA